MTTLNGVSVLVAGAGLAGLAAARDLVALGAHVTVVDARDRVGGRVWTVRDGFADGQHAEAGGDLIDEDQQEIRELAAAARAEARADPPQRLRLRPGRRRRGSRKSSRAAPRAAGSGWPKSSWPLTKPYTLAEHRWDSPITADLARRSVAAWLDEVQRRRGAARDGDRAARVLSRRPRGAVARRAGRSVLRRRRAGAGRAVSHRGRQRSADERAGRAARRPPASEQPRSSRCRIAAGPCASASRTAARCRRSPATTRSSPLPATLLRRMPITPALPAQQHDAIARLKYGRATKTLLQFSQPVLARDGTAARVRLAAALRRRLGGERRAARARRHPQPARRRQRQRRDAGDRRQARRARPGAARSTGSARNRAS